MTDRIVPNPDRCATAAIDALVALRPLSVNHIATGRYGHIIEGWRAQCVTLAARCADEVRQSRVRTATGQGLRELAASEFLIALSPDPSASMGVIRIARPTATVGGGIIRQGTRFRRVANPDASPIPISAASFVSTAPVTVGATAGLSGSPIEIPVASAQTGEKSSVPLAANGPSASTGVEATTMQIADPLFDPSFYVASFEAAGGSTGASDATIKRACLANGIGQYGPTSPAMLAAALSVPGAARAVVLDNTATGASCIYAVDESWGWSAAFASAVAGVVRRDAAGFGCLVESAKVLNLFVEVEAVVALRSARYAGDLDSIAEALRAAAVAYFDDRDDWYRWSLSGLRAALSRADRRIRGCKSVVARDAFTKAIVTPPGAPTVGNPLTHVYVARRGVTVTAG